MKLRTFILALLFVAVTAGSEPGAVISGRVVDTNGKPVEGFIISTFPAQYYYIPVDYPEG